MWHSDRLVTDQGLVQASVRGAIAEAFPCKSVVTVLLILHLLVLLSAEARPDILMMYAFTLQLLV